MKFGNPGKRTKVVATSFGHHIEFPGRTADGIQYVHVPKEVISDVLREGMEPEEDLPEEEATDKPQRPTDPEALKSQVFDAFEQIVKTGERSDFAASGLPTVAAVSKILGWTADGREVKDLWLQFQAKGD